MQLLAKFKKIMYVGFTATFNFQKFKVALNPMYRNFPEDWPKKLCSTDIPTRIYSWYWKMEETWVKVYQILKVVTLNSHINSAWQHATTCKIMLFNLQCNISVHCKKVQPVTCHLCPFVSTWTSTPQTMPFCKCTVPENICAPQDNSKEQRGPLLSQPPFQNFWSSRMKLNCNFQWDGKNLNQTRKLLWSREWVGIHIFWNNTMGFCLAKSFKQQLCLNNY